jgi:hypothetical protein
MENQIKAKKGRKKLPEGERKVPIRIYVCEKDVKDFGGELAVMEQLINYFNFLLKKRLEIK